MVGLVSRFVAWFWMGAEERAALGSGAAPSRVLELASRAAVAREAAERTWRPAEPFAQPGSDAIAAELFRESIEWALLAHAALGGDRATTAEVTTDPAKLFAALDPALVRRAAADEQEREELETNLSRSFRQFAELGAGAQRELAERFELASEALLEPLGGVEQRIRRIRFRRAVHAFGVLVLVGAPLLLVRHLLAVHRKASDLAAGAAWSASSRGPGGCESPRQLCAGGENYFFHTNMEDDPSIVFDLGRERAFSGIEIDNRIDCCTERADPLAVAVSSDKHAWREVARHTKDFTTWHQEFDTVRARYVKVHIPAPAAILHLSHVWILP